MAQVVRYFEDNVTFKEGPFVIVNACGWRIEVEHPGGKCPILPDISIYHWYKDNFGKHMGKFPIDEAEKICDTLNILVKTRKIYRIGNSWIHIDYYDELKG